MLQLKHLAAITILSGAIKVWQSSETVNTTDLNANFAHIHNKMVGGHGGRLIDADVNASAAIAYSKLNLAGAVQASDLANNSAIPRAYTEVLSTCTVGTCTQTNPFNVTSVVFQSTGTYLVTLNYSPAKILVITSMISSAAVPALECHWSGAKSGNTFQIACSDNSVAKNGSFGFVVYEHT